MGGNQQIEQIERTRRSVLGLTWGCAVIVMATSAANAVLTFQALEGNRAVGLGFGVAVDLALCIGLIGDRQLHTHGESSSWARGLRLTAMAISVVLNTGASMIQGHYFLGVVLCFLPVLLWVLTEYGQDVALKFTRLADSARVKAERPAQAPASPVVAPVAFPVVSAAPLPAWQPIPPPAARQTIPHQVDEPASQRVTLVEQVRRANEASNAVRWPAQQEESVAEVAPVQVAEPIEAPKRKIPPVVAPVRPVAVSPSRASKRNDSSTGDDHVSVVRQMLVDAISAGQPAPGHPAVTKRLGVTQYRARQLLQLARDAAATEAVNGGARRGRLAAVGQQSSRPSGQGGLGSDEPLAVSQQVASGSPGGQHTTRPASTTPDRSDRVRRAAVGGP
jgi:hypothetical protein